jgi:hypothetical protein
LLAGFSGFGASSHEAAEVADGSHLSGESSDGVLEEAGLTDGVAFFGALEGHGLLWLGKAKCGDSSLRSE